MSDPDGERLSQCKRDDEFWFEDGTVILVAQDVQFRVYKGILAYHSPIFSDMFSLPPPPHASYPVVELFDSASDWRHVLDLLTMSKGILRGYVTVFCARSECLFLRLMWTRALDIKAQPSFEEIAAYVRLGDKYQIAAVYEKAMMYLKRFYPTSLTDWKALPAAVPPGFDARHAIGVVNLARQMGELSILPAALLACCRLEEGLVPGFTYSDGRMETLSRDDLALCIRGIQLLSHFSVTNVFEALAVSQTKSLAECSYAQGPRRCSHRAFAIAYDHLVETAAADMANPFATIDISKTQKNHAKKICTACGTDLVARLSATQEVIWNYLPLIFGLGTLEGWPSQG